jgi:hypothetical protein
MVFLDQLTHLFDGLRRAVAVVAADEVDLAAVNSALFVSFEEIAPAAPATPRAPSKLDQIPITGSTGWLAARAASPAATFPLFVNLYSPPEVRVLHCWIISWLTFPNINDHDRLL